MAQKSSDVARQLADRVERAELMEGKPIDVQEFRHLFLKGLAALLRETDSIAYLVRNATSGGRR